ncbi:uncharacterized protein F5Z01DRAFT_676926 [Emericellopsis atlantica]|uniref:Uncharacterized protein n=1 Tax=Emericellopsis atlantica TaxID=2614577 RepID=A0A9P7ZG21_9HYPO|nr:uncharacterized protein F5Z01DRAFT_676926 [Emericellopsis atlantica]KAG9251439.1 hypothetical protein F5Z01DRAFT_676926 [Emericellopsis atlantica]
MASLISLAKLPFLLHDIIASFAGLTFILRPHKQLAPLSESAKLILHCYGGCLLFTNLISLIFLVRPDVDETTRLVAFAFAFWHAWPSYRAIARLQRGLNTTGELGKTLGGPWIHLAVHILLMALFLNTGLAA